MMLRMEEYDPLTYENLAKSVADRLLKQTAQAFPPSEPFDGAGVYAIYYVGPLPFYKFLTRPECRNPIYIGKAIPSGARKGQPAFGGRPLFSRLQQHAASIRATTDLSIEHFRCRFLTVKRVWPPRRAYSQRLPLDRRLAGAA